jgi:beta-lactam-binding protein with PASTA domain
MRKLATATILAAVLAMAMSGAALYKTRHLSSSKKDSNTTSTVSSDLPADQVVVPDATNKSAFAAGAALSNLKLKYTVTRTQSATVQKSMVISQSPVAGTTVAPGTSIALTVSNGP